jgi:hypothetical protein
LEFDTGTRILKILDVFASDYMYSESLMEFTISGWTNPGTTAPASMTWSSYAVLDSVDYIIDTVGGLSIEVTLGELNIHDIFPTDGNTMIYA